MGFYKKGTGKPSVTWGDSAKRDETRERRLDQLIFDSAGGRTISPLTTSSRTDGGYGELPHSHANQGGGLLCSLDTHVARIGQFLSNR